MIKTLIIFIGLLISLLLFSCTSLKKAQSTIYKAKTINVFAEAEKVKDSLNSMGIDTILIYYKGCSGCVEGVEKSVFVFWKKSSKIQVIKIGNYSNQSKAIYVKDIFSFYISNHSKIKSQILIPPKSELLHYHYSKIVLWYDSQIQFEKQISDFYRTNQNMTKGIMSWIYLIESTLFNSGSSCKTVF